MPALLLRNSCMLKQTVTREQRAGASTAHVKAVFAAPQMNDQHLHRFVVYVIDMHPGLAVEESELAVRL